jgi:hypothetical protein
VHVDDLILVSVDDHVVEPRLRKEGDAPVTVLLASAIASPS